MNPTMQYVITHSYLYHNYDVRTPNKQPLFHVVNSSFTPGKPDLTFHEGPDCHRPIVGVCKFRHFSSDCEIGLGSPDQPSKMGWAQMHKQSFKRVHWFRMKMDDGKQKTFTWKRTHALGTGHGKHKLVEESTQNVVAIFSSSGIFKTTDQMDIFSDLGPRFNLMALISGLAVIEQGRRTGAAAGGGGGGGGGC